jgi:hypothetical protein
MLSHVNRSALFPAPVEPLFYYVRNTASGKFGPQSHIFQELGEGEMYRSILKICILMLACLAVAAAGFAQQGTPAYVGSSAPPKAKRAKSHEKITLGIGGAEDKKSAEMLTSALAVNGLKGTVRESKGKPFELTTSVEQTTDLGKCAKAITEVNTPQKTTAAPTLNVVLFAPFTTQTGQQVLDKLASIPGIDAKNSKADVEKGELWVRISGDAKVTPTDISTAIQSAGVTGQMTKSGKGKQT